MENPKSWSEATKVIDKAIKDHRDACARKDFCGFSQPAAINAALGRAGLLKVDGPLSPSAALLCKLGSIIVHAEELTSPKGHVVDKIALEQLTNDPEVQAWMEAMRKMAMLPVKR